MSYRLSNAAQGDLVHIYAEGARRFGLDQADKYHDALEAAFGRLSEFPHMARLREEITPPVHAYPHQSHLILYVIEANGDILILRIRQIGWVWLRGGKCT